MSDNTAAVNSTYVNASFKYSVEICSYLKGRNLDTAINLLRGVETKKVAIPMKRYKKKVAHQKGIGPGRFPMNTSRAIISLLESVGKNAENKGLNREKLVISTMEANRSISARRSARFARGKLTNFTIVVKEE